MREGQLTSDQATKLESVAERFDLRLIVLFGSRATGRAPVQESDVDIAFSGRRKIEWPERFELMDALSEALDLHDDRLDLVEVTQASGLLLRHICRDGIVLYQARCSERSELCAYALRKYMDEARLRQSCEAYVRRRFGGQATSQSPATTQSDSAEL